MMTFLVVLLSVVLIADCFFLTLLVMVQLPKKDAGAGMAFGGGAADALFGAGSGNALTKLTKYASIIFFAVVLVLCVIDNNQASSNRLKNAIANAPSAPVETHPVTAPSAVPSVTSLPAASSNTVSLTSSTNSPPPATAPSVTPPATNTPPK